MSLEGPHPYDTFTNAYFDRLGALSTASTKPAWGTSLCPGEEHRSPQHQSPFSPRFYCDSIRYVAKESL